MRRERAARIVARRAKIFETRGCRVQPATIGLVSYWR
jgi:hypothetical protein